MPQEAQEAPHDLEFPEALAESYWAGDSVDLNGPQNGQQKLPEATSNQTESLVQKLDMAYRDFCRFQRQ